MTVFGRTPRPLSTFDISEIATWVDSRDYEAAYLDPDSGEMYPAFEGIGAARRGRRADRPRRDGLGGDRRVGLARRVPGHGGLRRGGGRPAAWHASSAVALGGRGAFRRFRDTMWHQPEEIGRAWNAYRELGAELRALEWLVDEGLVAEEDTHQARATRETAARDILEAVGGGPRPGSSCSTGCQVLGKSTLAERYRADHPGVLLCDPDRLRPMIGGDPLDARRGGANPRPRHGDGAPAIRARRGPAAAGRGRRRAAALRRGRRGGPRRAGDRHARGRPVPRTSAHTSAVGRKHTRRACGTPSTKTPLTPYVDGLEEIALRTRSPEVVCIPGDPGASYRSLLALVGREDHRRDVRGCGAPGAPWPRTSDSRIRAWASRSRRAS